MKLPNDPFTESLIPRLDRPGVIGIALTGSYARGENKQFSDVDVDIFVNALPPEPYTLRYWDDHLVSLKYELLENERLSLTRPERAIWSVPGLRQMQILLDPSGELAALRRSALSFDWLSLQPAANEYAVEELMGCAEEAHKIMGGLAREHESTVLYAVAGLLKGLGNGVAVQRGLMIESENRYYQIIQKSLGPKHEWTRAFRLALGADLGPVDVPAYKTRGASALTLYKHTAALFEDLITNTHRQVIEATLEVIQASEYVHG
ncbi:MAG: nucleotidyltransferase domain-containing protein [Chloroflexota bacterium]